MRTCQYCNHYKDGYCKILELYPNYPDIGCDYFENKGDKEWVPVSEGLPEVMDESNGDYSDDVLICVADDEQITISIGFYGYYPKSKAQQGWWSTWAYGCQKLDIKYKVVAWMLLPAKPYKVESEDKE